MESEHGNEYGIKGMENLSDRMTSDDEFGFVHLKRRDRLANVNKKWLAGDYKVNKVHFLPDWVEEMLQQDVNWENKSDSGVPPDRLYEIYYEDLVSSPQNEVDKLCDFLGIEPFPVEIKTKKQNKNSPREVIENYDELKSHFAGAEYAYCSATNM